MEGLDRVDGLRLALQSLNEDRTAISLHDMRLALKIELEAQEEAGACSKFILASLGSIQKLITD